MRAYKTRNSASGDLVSYYYDDDYSSSAITIKDIKNIIKNATLKNHYRLSILNPDESVKTIIPEEDILSGGSFNENYQNGQRRSISVTLFNEFKRYTPSINGIWSNVRFSYDVGIEMLNGSIVWFRKGVYVVTAATPTHIPGEKNVSLELSDKFSLFEGASGTLEMSYTIPVGTIIEDALVDILNLHMGNGERFDIKPMIYHSSFNGKKTQATISKEAGSNYGEIISELCTQLNAEYFYDVEGNFNVVPINDVTNDVDKPIIDDLYAEDGDFSSDNLSFSFNDIINRVYVIGSTVNGYLYQATAVNDDPSSPLCYQRIGYRTASPINDTNITSDVLAQDRADYELRQKLILKTSVSIDTPLNPFYIVNNITRLTDEFFGIQQQEFIIQSISWSIDYGGFMSVGLSSTQNLPFFVRGGGTNG